MMHGTVRETFVHKNSDRIHLQGARRAVFSLLTPWSTGLFGTATAVCSERLHPELKKHRAVVLSKQNNERLFWRKSRAKRIVRQLLGRKPCFLKRVTA
jgi:hypothetical protein